MGTPPFASALRPAFRYALHPILPQRLGFRTLLAVTEPELTRLLRIGDGYTLMSARNRTTLYREARAVLEAGVPGDFVEIGVHRGGSAAVLAGALAHETGRRLHLYDRWGDLPEPSVEDGIKQTEYARANIAEKLAELEGSAPFHATREIIEQKLGFERAVYWPGWYDETFARYDGAPIAFASVDCDYYNSVAQALRFVRTHAAPGCRIVLDDYGTWPGARQAADEFAAEAGVPVIPTPMGTALIHLPA